MGSEATLKVLLAAHANPKLADKRGRTVLVLAATRGDLSLVNVLLVGGVGADTHAAGESTPLLAAVRAGHVEVARSLLAAGAKADLADERGETPLLAAASSGNAALVKLLLAGGASARLADQRGETALWRAARAGAADTAHVLTRGRRRSGRRRPRRTYTADVRDRRGPRRTGLDPAPGTRAGRREGGNGDTPLMMAAAFGSGALVHALLQPTARPTSMPETGTAIPR